MWYRDSPPGAANEEFRVKVREGLGLLVSSLNWTSAFPTPHKHQLQLWRSHGMKEIYPLTVVRALGLQAEEIQLELIYKEERFFFPFIFISWRLITLQYYSGFCHTLT